MSGHCGKCGVYHEEDDDRLCGRCTSPAPVPYEQHEREMMREIDSRDRAEQALSQAFYIVTGRSPEWSNLFGHKEALEEIADAVALLKYAARNGKD